jgi:biopolymer transport protein ExbD
MTPMIDVIFLLLVFFVCTANFYPIEEILPMNATLPGSVEVEVVQLDPVNLDVVLIQVFFDQEPHWQVEGNQFTSLHEVQCILQLIRNMKADIPVIIESADNVPMENVIDVYDVCRRVGLTDIQFAAD